MKKKNENYSPIYYKDKNDLDKSPIVLMEELRNEISSVRGKLHDIKKTYGWDEWIEHLEGGMSCMLISMYATVEEWKKFEEKHKLNS